jgi:hypothetical protein
LISEALTPALSRRERELDPVPFSRREKGLGDEGFQEEFIL